MPKKGKVSKEKAKVVDGDTIKGNPKKPPVRLRGGDSPELSEKGGAAAKRALEKKIGGKKVTIDTKAKGPYGRRIADVKHKGKVIKPTSPSKPRKKK